VCSREPQRNGIDGLVGHQNMLQPVRGELRTWTDCPESPWIPDKENVTDNGLHIGSVAEAKRKDLLNFDSRFIGQLSDITLLLLSLSKCLWVIIRLKLWPVTFGKVIWTSDSVWIIRNEQNAFDWENFYSKQVWGTRTWKRTGHKYIWTVHS